MLPSSHLWHKSHSSSKMQPYLNLNALYARRYTRLRCHLSNLSFGLLLPFLHSNSSLLCFSLSLPPVSMLFLASLQFLILLPSIPGLQRCHCPPFPDYVSNSVPQPHFITQPFQKCSKTEVMSLNHTKGIKF